MAELQGDLRQTASRDDRAQRFIASRNAFFDHNQLAFVAFPIALAMDGLIFMAGLFGADTRAEPDAASRDAAELARSVPSRGRFVPLADADEDFRLTWEDLTGRIKARRYAASCDAAICEPVP